MEMEPDKAYDAAVFFTYYHCGGCRGHNTSMRVTVSDFKTVPEAEEQAKQKVRGFYPDMEIDFDRVQFYQYSVL